MNAYDVLRKMCGVAPPLALGQAHALSDAGVLLTPLHERALEACKKVAQYADKHYEPDPASSVVAPSVAIGREALALEKPLVRFIATQNLNLDGTPRGAWHVSDLEPQFPPRASIGPLGQEEARVVAEALNKLWQKRREAIGG